MVDVALPLLWLAGLRGCLGKSQALVSMDLRELGEFFASACPAAEFRVGSDYPKVSC